MQSIDCWIIGWQRATKGQRSRSIHLPAMQHQGPTHPPRGFHSFTGNTDLVITCDGEMPNMVATQINMKLSPTHKSNRGQNTPEQTRMCKDDFLHEIVSQNSLEWVFPHAKMLYIIEEWHRLTQHHNSWATLGPVGVNQLLFFHYHHGAKQEEVSPLEWDRFRPLHNTGGQSVRDDVKGSGKVGERWRCQIRCSRHLSEMCFTHHNQSRSKLGCLGTMQFGCRPEIIFCIIF